MRPWSWTLLAAVVGLIVSCSDGKPQRTRPAEDTGAGGSLGSAGADSGHEDPPEATTELAAGAAGSPNVTADEPTFCNEARSVVGPREHLSGDDFSEDFTDLVSLSDQTCHAAEGGGSDALFAVSLNRGQTLSVAENGGLDAVVSLKKSCDVSAPCAESSDEPDDPVLSYTAEHDETVYVVVQSYRSSPPRTDYDIRLDIDPECGNGILEAREPCDDGNNQDGDGCSASCALEFDHLCETRDKVPQSVCTPLAVYGPFAGGEPILGFEHPDVLEQDQIAYYLVEFSERVVVNGLVEASAGNADIVIYGEGFEYQYSRSNTGSNPGESIDELGLVAGTYLFAITARRTLESGFVMTLETRSGGACGDGEFEPVFEACDNADGPGCADCSVLFGWECVEASPSVCTQIEDLGELGRGSTVLAVEDPTARDDFYLRQWMVTFTADVLLSGSFGAMDTNLLGLALTDEDGDSPISVVLDSGETFAGMPVPAGTYRISAQIYGDLSDDGYVLNLTTESQQ